MANKTKPSTEIVTESIVVLASSRSAGSVDPLNQLTILGTDGRELSLNCTPGVAKQVAINGYTHNKTRSYTLLLTGDTITDIVPGQERTPRGLKLAVLARNAEPSNAIVLQRDKLSDGSYGRVVAIQVPMGFGPERLSDMLEGMASWRLGKPVGNGYKLFRTIQQAPGVEFYVLAK